MQTHLIQGLDHIPGKLRGCVLTIGNFDGMHLGHRRIIERARELAGPSGRAVAAMTFEPPPDQVLRPADRPQRIMPYPRKCHMLLEAGVDWIVTLPPDQALLEMTPDAFIDRVISGRIAPSAVVEGRDFRFGRGRSGDVETLAARGPRAGFAVHVVEPVVLDFPEGPQRVSSSLVRRLVAEGRIEEANRCLGRDFALYGTVAAGQGQGRLLEFPTANIDPGEQVCPADGVYAGRAEIEGQVHRAAISVGNKPTLGPVEGTIVEAFLLDAHGDYYGRETTLRFTARLRGQKRFDDVASLRGQIAEDIQRVRALLQ
jgi:riboflavin kinase/FMN adenylyltransferase